MRDGRADMDIDYKSLIENIFDGLYLVDKNRSIIYWNHVAEKITGYRSDEVIGRRCRDNILVHVDENGKNLCHGRCPLAGHHRRTAPSAMQKSTFSTRTAIACPSGSVRRPLRDTAGNIIGGAELFTDLSTNNAITTKVQRTGKTLFSGQPDPAGQPPLP